MLTLGFFVGVCVFILTMHYINQKKTKPRTKTRLAVLTVWTLAILIWPILWITCVGSAYDQPSSWIGLLWPIIIIILDILSMRHNTYQKSMESKRNILTMDANTICSLTFAVSAILGGKHECCKNIFMYAIICCIAFVIPSPHLVSSSQTTIMTEAIQKSVLAYATGLLLSGIFLAHFSKKSSNSPGISSS